MNQPMPESGFPAFIARSLAGSREVAVALEQDARLHQVLADAATACVNCLRTGHKILLAGNGGSAADCQHIAAELVGRFMFDRAPLPAIALTTDTSALTAIGNDYGFESVFSRQLAALGQAGDVFIGLSTSGNSANILAAARQARTHGLVCIGLTGRAGGALREHCDVLLDVPADATPDIQVCHITLGHLLCDLIERALFIRP